MDILNFVWWIGIGHAGTLISAILLLLRQKWRTSINRFAEAMTLFAVAQAGMYPIMHLGRPWLALLAVSLSEHDGNLAAVSQPFDVGRVCGFDLRDRFRDVLVCRIDSRLCDAARSRPEQTVSDYLRPAGDGLARFCASLASLRNGLSAAGRPGDAAGAFGAHDRQFRLCGRHHSRLARDDLSALLRRRRHLRRLCDGAVADDSAAKVLRPGRLHHHAPHAQHGEGDAGDRADCRLRLHDGSVLWLVQRQQIRALHDLEPHARTLCLLLLGLDSLQHHDAAVSLDQEDQRSNLLVLWLISIVVSIGMWLERFVIVVTSLHRDFLPSSWGMYSTDQWDWSMFIGTIGFFFTLLFLFIRFLPMISIFEMRTILPEAEVEE